MIPLRDNIPSRRAPVMTVLLIGANAAAFLYELRVPARDLPALFFAFGLVPARLLDFEAGAGLPALLPLVTSMFLHGGWLHLVGNLWTLWIFGDNVEDRMGRIRFLVFYCLTGIAAGLTHVVTNPTSTMPTVGASGAIAGVMGAYFVLFPRARVLTVAPFFLYPVFFEIPAFYFLAYWFLAQVFSGALSVAGPGSVGGIAWWAHGGGFVAGALLHPLFARRRRSIPVLFAD
jgi:membrane associated rhomboid family serine protease